MAENRKIEWTNHTENLWYPAMKNELKNNEKLIYDKYVITAYLLKVDSKGKTSKKTIIRDFDKGTLFENKIIDIQQYEKWIHSLNNESIKRNSISSLGMQKTNTKKKVSYSIEIFVINVNKYFLQDYSNYGYLRSMYKTHTISFERYLREYKFTKLVDIQNINKQSIELVKKELNLMLNQV